MANFNNMFIHPATGGAVIKMRGSLLTLLSWRGGVSLYTPKLNENLTWSYQIQQRVADIQLVWIQILPLESVFTSPFVYFTTSAFVEWNFIA